MTALPPYAAADGPFCNDPAGSGASAAVRFSRGAFFGMDKTLIPDIYVDRYSDISPQMLLDMGIKGLLADVDETLVPHGLRTPTPELVAWLGALRAAGIRVCILSNNSQHRIRPFADSVGLPFMCRCFKPNLSAAKKALAVLRLQPSEVAVIGDQIFTDLRMAVRLGAKSILTDPLGEEYTAFVRLKRLKEKKYKRLYRKTAL